MKKNVEITISKELIIPRDVFSMEDLLKLQNRAISICKISTNKEQKTRCLRFVLAINDLKQQEELDKIQQVKE